MANRLIPATARGGALLDIGCGSHPHFLLQAPVAERVGIDRLAPPDGALVEGVPILHHDLGYELRTTNFELRRCGRVLLLAQTDLAGPL
jgi:hypothetical protein